MTVEEDGRAHLEETLERDEGFRRAWEAGRPARELGIRVLRRRAELGWSQEELAARTEADQDRIDLIESGEAYPAPKTLEELEDVLGIQLVLPPEEQLDEWRHAGFLLIDEEEFQIALELFGPEKLYSIVQSIPIEEGAGLKMSIEWEYRENRTFLKDLSMRPALAPA